MGGQLGSHKVQQVEKLGQVIEFTSFAVQSLLPTGCPGEGRRRVAGRREPNGSGLIRRATETAWQRLSCKTCRQPIGIRDISEMCFN